MTKLHIHQKSWYCIVLFCLVDLCKAILHSEAKKVALLRASHCLLCHILMLNLSVNFTSVANHSQQFRLLHHQYSINIWR